MIAYFNKCSYNGRTASSAILAFIGALSPVEYTITFAPLAF